jgi:hypothetical protein
MARCWTRWRWRALDGQPDLVLEAGFAAAYGSKSAREDMAKYVGTLQQPTGANPGPCARFGGSRLDEARATTYAKLVLLSGVGLISDQNFLRCVQGTRIEPARGIDFGGVRKFQINVHAGVVGQGSETAFDVLAEGPSNYEILIHLSLGAPKSPLGLHLLEPLGLGDIGSGSENPILLLQGDNLQSARASAQGFVLVTENTSRGSKGAVFGLELNNAFDVPIEFWPFGMFSGSL